MNVLPVILTTIGGLIMTAMLSWIIVIITYGGWTDAVETGRIDVLATIASGCLIMIAMTMIALLIAGPIGRISAKIGTNEFTIDDDDGPDAPTQEVTTDIMPVKSERWIDKS